MKKILEVFAKNLSTIRNSRGMSQEQLSGKSGVSFRMIQYLEAGKRFFGEDTVASLAKALDVEETDLFTAKLPDPIKIQPTLEMSLEVVSSHLTFFDEKIDEFEQRIRSLEQRIPSEPDLDD